VFVRADCWLNCHLDLMTPMESIFHTSRRLVWCPPFGGNIIICHLAKAPPTPLTYIGTTVGIVGIGEFLRVPQGLSKVSDVLLPLWTTCWKVHGHDVSRLPRRTLKTVLRSCVFNGTLCDLHWYYSIKRCHKKDKPISSISNIYTLI